MCPAPHKMFFCKECKESPVSVVEIKMSGKEVFTFLLANCIVV